MIQLADVRSGSPIPLDAISPNLIPLGSVIEWYRPDPSIAPPAGWVPCDGRDVLAADHDFPGGGTITLGDMTGRTSMTAKVTVNRDGSGGAYDEGRGAINADNWVAAPGIRRTAGTNATRDLRHSHTVAGHSHTMGNHYHFFGGVDHLHGHNQKSTVAQDGGPIFVVWVISTPATSASDRGLGENTGGPSTNSTGAASDNGTSGAIQDAAPNDLAGGATDLRSAHHGFLHLVKVKNSAAAPPAGAPLITIANLRHGEAVREAGLDPVTIPLGTVIDFWRPSPNVPVPAGWAAFGTHVAAGAHDFPGVGAFDLPDVTGKHAIGARLTVNADGTGGPADGTASTAGDGFANAPGINGTGGSNRGRNMQHRHTQNSHTHSLQGHYHYTAGVDHLHRMNQTIHNISQASGGAPVYQFSNDTVANSDRSLAQYTSGPNVGDTGAAAPSTDNQLSATTDFRLAHVGALKLVKIKHSADPPPAAPTNLRDVRQRGQLPVSAVDPRVVPLGCILKYWRPSSTVGVPAGGGWEQGDGRRIVAASHDFGAGNGNAPANAVDLPDLPGKVIVAARLTVNADGTGGAADGIASSLGDAYGNAPGIGGQGGILAGVNLAHAQTVNSHVHSQDHSHSRGGVDHLHGMNQKTVSQANTGIAPMQHLNDTTSGADRGLGEWSGGASPGNTDGAGPATDSQLTTVDHRSLYYGLARFVKVRNS